MSAGTRQFAFSKRFSRLPLRKKIIILISGVSAIVVSLAMLISFFIELRYFRSRLLQDYETTARMIATNLEAAVAFNDELDSRDILEALRQREFVEVAGVYLQDGTLLASFHRETSDTPLAPPSAVSISRLQGSSLVVNEPIVQNGQEIGRLVLQARLGEIDSFLTSHSWIFGSLLGMSILIAVVLAARVGRSLSRPILELAKTAQRITVDHDFSTRQQRISDDESGQLVDAFNEMMEKIEAREEEILQAKENAEASSRAKDDFLSVISHELRTPLNPIIGYVEILLRKLEVSEDRRQLGLVKQYAEHLQGLIDGVIDYSRYERDIASLNLDPVDYVNLCSASIDLLKRDAEKKNISLSCEHSFDDVHEERGTTILADRVKLQQILLNLLANAIKFTPSGSIMVRTRISHRGIPPRHLLRIEVADTGIGISAEDRDKVFKPFSQIDESLTRQYSGMGLGLAITQKIVHTMGGAIDFESEKGAGTLFWLEIPVALSDEPEPDPAAIEELVNTQGTGKGRVLLVDDQLVNLELAESMLTGSGQEVVCARSGPEAIERAKEEEFSLIIMDIKMPKMNGYETARALRQMEDGRRRTPIVAMTAHVTTRGSEECFEAGMDDFLAKPFDTAKLNLILRKWLNGKPDSAA